MFNELQEVLDATVEELGAPADVEDPGFHVLAHGRHDGAVDAVRLASILQRRATPEVRAWFLAHGIDRADGPVVVPPHPDGSALGRLCVPLRHQGRLLGYLWLIDDGRAADSAWRERAAAQGARLARVLQREEIGQRAASDAVERLLSPDPEVRRLAAEDAAVTGVPGPPVALAVLRPAAAADDRLDAWLARAVVIEERRSLAGLVLDGCAVLVVGVAVPVRRLAEDLARTLRTAVSAGTAGPVGSLADVAALRRPATLAERIVRAFPERGPVAHWSDLGPLRAAAWLAATDPEGLTVDERLGALAGPDARLLAETAQAFCDRGGDVAGTARTLGVHRASVYHRLGRIETLTGLDLRRGDDRTTAHLGLLRARLALR